MPNYPATSKSTQADGTSADETPCRAAKQLRSAAYARTISARAEKFLSGRSSALPLLGPRHEELLHAVDGGCKLVLLNRSCRVNMFGTNPRTLTHERASPDALGMGEHRHALCRPLIARVLVVTMRKRQCCRPDEYRIKSRNRTGCIAEQTVNTHAVLAEFFELVWRLQIFAPTVAIFMDQPRFHLLQLLEELRHLDYKVAHNRKVSQRLDSHWSRQIL